MGKLLAVMAFVLAASTASAQSGQWVRISMTDGRSVDGQITGGDAVNYFVQTQHGYFSIARANVVAVTPLQAPAPAPTGAPPPPPPPMGPPADTSSSGSLVMNKGFRVAVGSYLLTAIIAVARSNEDDDAKYGFVPIAGPIMWSSKNDEDDFFEDGWDYLAVTATACQVAGIFMMLTHKGSGSSGVLSITPTAGKRHGGLAIAGTW